MPKYKPRWCWSLDGEAWHGHHTGGPAYALKAACRTMTDRDLFLVARRCSYLERDKRPMLGPSGRACYVADIKEMSRDDLPQPKKRIRVQRYATTPCKHDNCRRPWRDHGEDVTSGTGKNRTCPDYPGQTFQARRYDQPRRISNSFSAEELAVAEAVMSGVATRKDVRHLVRMKAFSSLARKVQQMGATLEQRKNDKAAEWTN